MLMLMPHGFALRRRMGHSWDSWGCIDRRVGSYCELQGGLRP